MKFDMGSSTLSTLAKGTDAESQNLGSLVQSLVDAVTPFEGVFNGQGRAAFDSFKARTDEVAAELNSSLQAILGGQVGMDTAFQTGDVETADNASQATGQANFDGARFGSSR